MIQNKEIILILDNIRSTHNVGSIFRTADAARVSKIYLVGITPDPIDRFGRKRSDISKASLGAEESIEWEHSSDMASLISKLKEKSFEVVALEQSELAIDYKEFQKTSLGLEKLALILGSEVEGISKDILSLCDKIIDIPMLGEKESLNVSVATGVALFRILNI